MNPHLATRRGWALALLAVVSVCAQPVWAACNPKARINPQNSTTVPELTNGVPTIVTLDGSGSTPNKPDYHYAWSVVPPTTPAGLSVTFNTSTSAITTFAAPSVPASGGSMRVRLTVTCEGETDFIETIVNVTDVFQNSPPTASAFISPLNATEGQTVTLDGSASSDPDGDPITYAWTQIGTPTVTRTNVTPNGAVQSFVAPNLSATTTLTFRLTVSDASTSGSTDKTVSIVFTNDPPIAALDCPADQVLMVDEGDEVTFSSAGSLDPEGGALSYLWTQNSGPPPLGIGGLTTPSITFTAPQLGYQQLGGTSIALKVTDPLTAFATKTCGLFINDVTAPVIVVPDDKLVEATSAAGAQVLYEATAQDAVEDLVPEAIACDPPSGSTFPLDITTMVACSASDANGNSDTQYFGIHVQDTTPPTLTVPGDTAAEADGPLGSIVTFDAHSDDLVDGNKVADCVPPSGSLFALGDTLVTCNAVDAHGNAAASDSFTVSVLDTTPPTIDPHGDEGPFEATGSAGAPVTYTPPATHDVVDGDGVATCAPPSGSTFPVGETTVLCDATDAAGNDAVQTSFKVTVEDTTPPVIDPHADIEDVEATSAAGAVVTYTAPLWHDIVSGTGSATCLPASGATFALGTTTVTCNAQDGAGNHADAVTFTVEVVDTTAPVIAAHSNITGVEATGPTGASVVYVAPLWTDAVDGSGSATCAPLSGSTFALGTTTVTCNQTDAAGNAATPVTFTIQVVDTTPPSLTAMSNLVLDATSGSGAVGTWTNPTATDIVSGNLPVTCSPASGSTFYTGPDTTVTCSATDGAGLTGYSSFTVHVRYVFSGFFRPVDNLPTTNTVKAGQAIPVKFSLGGNQGLAIFETGYPKSVVMNCAFTISDAIEETVTAGGSTLQYDAAAGQYIYVWKSDKAWAGTCRQLQVKYKDGTTQVANFNFTR